MTNPETHPLFTEIGEQYLHLTRGQQVKVEDLSLEKPDLTGAVGRLEGFADDVTQRHMLLVARWSGRTAIGQRSSIVSDFREVGRLPEPDTQGRDLLEVRAERGPNNLGFVFRVSDGRGHDKKALTVNAVLPTHTIDPKVLATGARKMHEVRVATERYGRLHYVDQITGILDDQLDFTTE